MLLFDDSSEFYDQLFPPTNNILENGLLLADDYIPDHIVARDAEKKIVAHNLSPITQNSKPNNMYIWGDNGVGKTIVVRHIISVLKDGLARKNKAVRVSTITINCKMIHNTNSALYDILYQLTGTKPKQKLNRYNYFNQICDVINTRARDYQFYAIIIFLDEIDGLQDPNDILYMLTRAKTTQQITANNVVLGIILATNQRKYIERLDPAVISSGAFRECPFPDYNVDELYQILQSRKDAFKQGVISNELLLYCADKVAEKYHGDARKVIDIIRESAYSAIEKSALTITINDIDAAEKIVNARGIFDSLKNLTLHDKLILLAISIANDVITREAPNSLLLSGVVLAAYRGICVAIGKEPNNYTYASSRITALAKKQYIHAEKRENYGNTKSIHTYPELDGFIEKLFDPATLQLIKMNYSDIEALIIPKIKKQKRT